MIVYMFILPLLYHLQSITCLFQGDRDETNKVNESTAEADAEDLYEVCLFLASVGSLTISSRNSHFIEQ
jgi:hypothetical protein